ncbi:NADH:ubiquinone reductase (Na(+)-transporting) subunit C [Echinicola sp. CAU 1574]|uniref:Na(+)-translocating NADH-quinone reductase subunit C n=1 Tax=Echinicola arenosa TaxID=2774144 RepID=A0ABR9AGM5_9BACT|nr:NADH:ubiquinone reductase (Na(+)-transporting) subunit C [Echinicola arenosa]MBD8487931.1 NADH:ubiquinone reductase (Na(+)-transporting) subunit C [Echinicola arenosa]
MQQSNTYIITFSVILTVVLGFLLSGTSQLLGPIQKEAVALDTKKQILGAVMDAEKIAAMKPNEIKEYYENTISSKVVNIKGEEVTEQEGAAVTAETVDVAKNYKKPADERLYPVYIYHEEGSEDKVVAYILPLYGAGLWDAIWGYLALKTDLNTIEGVTFAHAGETPGLGARITTGDVQSRYEGKKIYDESGELVAVEMQKGEGKDYSGDEHKVDGMSGATLTAKGVNNMFVNYLGAYESYLEKVKGNS